jgi:peptidoglycan/LPS O-acetylase OafA/YrhL
LIFLAYLFGVDLIVFLIRGVYSFEGLKFVIGSQVNNGMYAAQFGNLWYIPALILCYLTLPMLQRLRKRGKVYLYLYVIVTALGELFLVDYLKTTEFYGAFALAYLINSEEQNASLDPEKKLNVWSYLYPVLLVAGFVAMWWYFPILEEQTSGFLAWSIHYVNGMSGPAIGVYGALAFLRFFRGLNNKPENPTLAHLGALSFQLYLVHESFLVGCFDVLHPANNLAYGATAAILLAALAAWALEKIQKDSQPARLPLNQVVVVSKSPEGQK